VDWTACRNPNDVRQKTLQLIRSKDKNLVCPPVKVMAKTCKNKSINKRQDNNPGKKNGKGFKKEK
jgi:hypothetical protein